MLPPVRRWSFSNEPNQPSWLRPQFARSGGITYPAAAVAYRAMVRGGIAGLRASGHGGDQMLLGETSPIGRETGRLATRPVPPAAFIRTLLCMDAGGDRLRGKAAAVRGCKAPRPLRVTGFAHHPYTQGGSQPPLTRGRRATEITISSAGRLARLLDAGARLRRIPKLLPIHYTEHGFQTNPPDLLFGVSPARQAEYINQSDWIAYRDRRIRTVAQYKLIDDTVVSSFQSGLRFFDGVPKPAFDAYRLPLWVKRKGAARLRVYGQVRPLAARRRRRAWSSRTPRSAPVRSGPWRRSRCARPTTRSCGRSRAARAAGGCAGSSRTAASCSRARPSRPRADHALRRLRWHPRAQQAGPERRRAAAIGVASASHGMRPARQRIASPPTRPLDHARSEASTRSLRADGDEHHTPCAKARVRRAPAGRAAAGPASRVVASARGLPGRRGSSPRRRA